MKALFKQTQYGPWKTAGDDTQYRITDTAQERVVVLQGSSSDIDWRDNFDIAIAPYRDMPVKWYAHRGFVRAWKAAQEQIIDELMHKLETRPILVLGYSHGAGIATLLHEDLSYYSMPVTTHIFGGPRCLWMPPQIVRDRFKTFHRWETNGDIVTLSPPAWFFYQHVGIQHRIGPKRFPSHLPHYPAAYLANLPDDRMV